MTTPKDILYFGVWPGYHGHSLWRPDGRHWSYGLTPWTARQLDSGLCPRDPAQPQGVACIHHRAGWTALAFWDRTGDSRPGSNSVLLREGICSASEMLAAAQEALPAVMARIGVVTVDSHQADALLAVTRAGRGGPG